MLLLGLACTVSAGAQTPPGRVDASIGVRWTGTMTFPSESADETTLGNGQLVLFNSATALEGSAGIEARIGARLTSTLRAEGTFARLRPTLRTRITSDAEGIPDTTAIERITEYTVAAGVTAQLARWRIGRLAPFAAAGGGYLRQLHEGSRLVETGRTYYVGVGGRYPLMIRARGRLTSAGIRADARAAFSTGGVALDGGGTRATPSLSIGLFVGL
jgi:hypothetical protein